MAQPRAIRQRQASVTSPLGRTQASIPIDSPMGSYYASSLTLLFVRALANSELHRSRASGHATFINCGRYFIVSSKAGSEYPHSLVCHSIRNSRQGNLVACSSPVRFPSHYHTIITRNYTYFCVLLLDTKILTGLKNNGALKKVMES